MVLVRINDAASPHGLNRQTADGFGSQSFHYFHLNLAVSLEDSENRDLISGSPASFSLSLSPKVGIVSFHFPLKPIPIVQIGHNALPDQIGGLQNRGIGKINLLADLPGRHLQFEQFDYPKPLGRADFQLPDPGPAELRKPVFASSAAVSLTRYLIDFWAAAIDAQNASIFAPVFSQIFLSSFLTFYDGVKPKYVH
jgi:hypothetical protein